MDYDKYCRNWKDLGRADIDKGCPNRHSKCTGVVEEGDFQFSASLNMSNLKENNNKFYIM